MILSTFLNLFIVRKIKLKKTNSGSEPEPVDPPAGEEADWDGENHEDRVKQQRCIVVPVVVIRVERDRCVRYPSLKILNY